MKGVGFTKEELIAFTKKLLPEFIESDFEEHEDYFVFHLKWNHHCCLKQVITKMPFPKHFKSEEVFLNRIRDNTKKEIEKTILDFKVGIIEDLIKAFNLEDFYKEKYRDDNVLYKVKKWCNPRPNIKTNLEFYYDEKANELLTCFKPLWEVFIADTTSHKHKEEIIDYLHGAIERIKQLIFAKDRIEDVLKDNSANRDILFVTNFYIFHFISLVKSLGDNLAWLLKLYCNFKLNEKKTDLNFESFKHCLDATNKKLYNCIFGNKQFADFGQLKTFRDIIHHKHALHLDLVRVGFSGKGKVMIAIDPKSGLLIDGQRYIEKMVSKRAEASDQKSIAKYGIKQVHIWTGSVNGMPWEDPRQFCQRYVELMTELYNSACQRMFIELTRVKIGTVTNYLSRIGIAIGTLNDEIHTNDKILIEGATTSFIQDVFSMEIEKKKVDVAKAGQAVAIETTNIVREGDVIYKLPSS
jgi:hypothetical protein